MSKKSVVGYSEHRRTDLHIDEAGDKFTINTVQDAEPIVEANKRRYNDYGDKLSVGKRGEWHHAASVPFNVQSVITVGSSAVATNVTSAKILGIHTDGEIYFNFSSSSSASVSTANDLKLAAGLTFINVPKFSGSGVSQYMHHQRVGSSNVSMRLVHV
jgi:hypothetical protein